MSNNGDGATLAVIAVLSAVKHVVLAVSANLARRRPVNVGHVSRLVVYPVKSIKGIDVQHAKCHYTGLEGITYDDQRDQDIELPLKDRTWMVTSTSYNYVTARQVPKMTTIVPSIHGNRLRLEAPGMEPIDIMMDNYRDQHVVQTKVWGDSIEAIDCGDEASAWLNSYLGRGSSESSGYRLVYHKPELEKRRCDQGPTRWHKTAKLEDRVVFSDGFPFMLMNESSVDELNERLVRVSALPVSMDHFRPNIVVANSFAFDEDDWRELHVGDVTFYNIKPCQRCVLTTVNPKTGVKRKDNEPLATLRRYRLLEPEFGQSPCLGINLVLREPGEIYVGDVVRVVRQTD